MSKEILPFSCSVIAEGRHEPQTASLQHANCTNATGASGDAGASTPAWQAEHMTIFACGAGGVATCCKNGLLERVLEIVRLKASFEYGRDLGVLEA